MNNKLIEHWKRKLVELEEKSSKLKIELEANQNIKLSKPIEDLELEETISYLKDWIEFYQKEIEKYKAKLRKTEQIKEEQEKISVPEKNIEESFKFIFKDVEEKPIVEIKVEKKPAEEIKRPIKEKILNIKERFIEFKTQKPLISYTVPFIILLLLITSLFLFKPEISGYVVLTQEKTYDDNLNLQINESSDYTWTLKNPGKLKSIKATGSVTGNGTVKIYIEKGGEKYLIYQNK